MNNGDSPSLGVAAAADAGPNLKTIVPVVGLVGGVGCGKSSVAAALAAQRHVVIVDGDRAGHDALQFDEVKSRIAAAFGGDVFTASGEVDRAALGSRVFGDTAVQQNARRQLEAIVHPGMTQRLIEQIREARAVPGVWAVLLDAALLLETGWRSVCDAVVFVDTPDELRRSRVQAFRNWSEEQWRKREASQWPLEEKRKLCDCEIDNSGDIHVAADQLRAFIERVFHRGGSTKKSD